MFSTDRRHPLGQRTLWITLATLTAIGATFWAWAQFQYPLTGIDDANIYFVYARNFAGGHGFVYNVGGERVEGFTSLLWVLVCSVAFRMSARPEPWLLASSVAAMSVVLGSGVLWVTRRFSVVADGSIAALLAALFLWLVTTPEYVTWTTVTLMDTGLWCALLFSATLVVLTEDRRLGSEVPPSLVNASLSGLLVLLVLARPEAFLWTPLLVLALVAARARRLGWRVALKSVALPGGATILSAACLTVFRLEYFGFPLPNTFYAKVSPLLWYDLRQGGAYLLAFARSGPEAWLGVAGALIGVAYSAGPLGRHRGTRETLPALPWLTSAGLLIPVLTGGDHFGSFRQYQCVWPILVLNLLYVVWLILPPGVSVRWTVRGVDRKRLWACGLLASAALLVRIEAWHDWGTKSGVGDFDGAVAGREVGEYLNRLFVGMPRLPRVGVAAAGAAQLAYRGDMVDLFGLNDTRMAHNGGTRIGFKNCAAFEKSTFFELKPDMVMPFVTDERHWPESRLKNDLVADAGAFKRLEEDARFRHLYVFGSLRLRQDDSRVLVAYFARDFLDGAAVFLGSRLQLIEWPHGEP
jgi:arabinofuranosyltransferase